MPLFLVSFSGTPVQLQKEEAGFRVNCGPGTQPDTNLYALGCLGFCLDYDMA